MPPRTALLSHPLHTVCVFTRVRGETRTLNLLYDHTHTVTLARSITNPSVCDANGHIARLITKETGAKQAPGRDRLAFSV